MPVDFLQVRNKVVEIGKQAPQQLKELGIHRDEARDFLLAHAGEQENLLKKVEEARSQKGVFMRFAGPGEEKLDVSIPAPRLITPALILGADGSQIIPDRHLAINYYLVNIGVIEYQIGSGTAPEPKTYTDLDYGAILFSEGQVALKRDLLEREKLAELVPDKCAGTLTLTDGPLELFKRVGREGDNEEVREFQKSLEAYVKALRRVYEKGAMAAGYVDKPRSNLVVHTLEAGMVTNGDYKSIQDGPHWPGVTDIDLFRGIINPGERSAVFSILSKSSDDYLGETALHFFYLNVGSEDHPWLVRVEIPLWVKNDATMLGQVQTLILQQCEQMGNRPFPYVLHRAHEIAVVTYEEKQQITDMIMIELERLGVGMGEESYKQYLKNISGSRRRFQVGRGKKH